MAATRAWDTCGVPLLTQSQRVACVTERVTRELANGADGDEGAPGAPGVVDDGRASHANDLSNRGWM